MKICLITWISYRDTFRWYIVHKVQGTFETQQLKNHSRKLIISQNFTNLAELILIHLLSLPLLLYGILAA